MRKTIKYLVTAVLGAVIIPMLLEALAAFLHWLEIGDAVSGRD